MATINTLDLAAQAAAEAAAQHSGITLDEALVAAIRRRLRGTLPDHDEHAEGDLLAELNELADVIRSDTWKVNARWIASVARRASKLIFTLRGRLARRLLVCCGDPYQPGGFCFFCGLDAQLVTPEDVERAREDPLLPKI